jgi:hypothetical protein
MTFTTRDDTVLYPQCVFPWVDLNTGPHYVINRTEQNQLVLESKSESMIVHRHAESKCW